MGSQDESQQLQLRTTEGLYQPNAMTLRRFVDLPWIAPGPGSLIKTAAAKHYAMR